MTATHSGQPPVDSFKAYVASIRPPPGTDLTYRPEPMLQTMWQGETVSRKMRQLMRQREDLRAKFVPLNEACDRAEDDDAVSVEKFEDMDRRRNKVLDKLNRANDRIIGFDPQNMADLAMVIAMARHQIATSEVPEYFLEHLLSAVERLVLEQGSVSRRAPSQKGGA